MLARTRQAYLFAAVAAILGVVLAGTALAQSNNEVGVWKLNVAKSKYSPGPAPTSATTKIEAAGAGVKTTVDQALPPGPFTGSTPRTTTGRTLASPATIPMPT